MLVVPCNAVSCMNSPERTRVRLAGSTTAFALFRSNKSQGILLHGKQGRLISCFFIRSSFCFWDSLLSGGTLEECSLLSFLKRVCFYLEKERGGVGGGEAADVFL